MMNINAGSVSIGIIGTDGMGGRHAYNLHKKIVGARVVGVFDVDEKQAQKMVAVGFMRRFDPQHERLKEAIHDGVVGRPVAFKGVHRNKSIPSNFPADTVISQAAIHDIDSCRWLLEGEIEEVYVQGARVDKSLSSDVREFLLLQFSLAENRLASIEVHLSARYGYEVSAEIIGELGVAKTNQPASINVRTDEARSTKIPPDWLGRFQDAYVAELESWVTSIPGHSFIGADAWDGYVSLVVSDACINSLASGRPEQVTLPKKPTLYH